MVRQLKFDGRRELGFPLGNLLAWPVAGRFGPLPADRAAWRPLVVPVPLHPERLRERGYNQAGLVGAGLAAGLGLHMDEDLITRVKGGVPQSSLDREARLHVLEGAFARGRPVRGRQPEARAEGRDVLLVDDVLTTGATLDACARVLKGLGARRVFGCTVAVGMPLRAWHASEG